MVVNDSVPILVVKALEIHSGTMDQDNFPTRQALEQEVVNRAVVVPWPTPRAIGALDGRRAWPVEAAVRHAPTLAASIFDCSNNSCSPDRSLLFSHFDIESILWSYALHSILRPYSRPYVTVNLSSATDPNLMAEIIHSNNNQYI